MSKKKLNFDQAFSDLEKISEDDEKQIEENIKEDMQDTDNEPEKISSTENQDNDSEQDNNEDENKNNNLDPWTKKEKDYYRTTITIDSETEENYLNCKRKFRRQLKTRLTKQDAVEIGMILLRKLDPKIIKQIRKNFTPEDDIIEKVKELIKKYE